MERKYDEICKTHMTTIILRNNICLCFRTDDLIQTAIRTLFKEATVLCIAHRLQTIADMDRVMVCSIPHRLCKYLYIVCITRINSGFLGFLFCTVILVTQSYHGEVNLTTHILMCFMKEPFAECQVENVLEVGFNATIYFNQISKRTNCPNP